MNSVQLVGRLTKDPELKLTQNQTQFCSFIIAVDRKFKDSNGQRQADFINCLAWKQNAAFIQKYFHKGNRIGLTGTLQTRSYDDQDGQRHFITEVVIDGVEFVESVKEDNSNAQLERDPIKEESLGESASGELPFNI